MWKSMQDTITVPVTEIKVPIKIKENWEAAAKKQGMSLVDFLIAAADDAMTKIPTKQSGIKLSVRDQIQIAEALLNPPPLNEAMQKALSGHYSHMTEATQESMRKHFESTRDV
jgi:uncharacterized protein (DUF1778 family)